MFSSKEGAYPKGVSTPVKSFITLALDHAKVFGLIVTSCQHTLAMLNTSNIKNAVYNNNLTLIKIKKKPLVKYNVSFRLTI
jgi:hypothetical protein